MAEKEPVFCDECMEAPCVCEYKSCDPDPNDKFTRTVTRKEALEMMGEYIEKWPYSMGEKHCDRWVKHLVKLNLEGCLKSFDTLIMKKEKAFTFEQLASLAYQFAPKRGPMDDIREWREKANIEP